MTPKEAGVLLKQEQTLLKLRRLHRMVGAAKAKANAWIAPLILGAASGIALFLLVGILAACVHVFLLGKERPSVIPALAGLVALIAGWTLTTRALRRRAGVKASVLAPQARASLDKAVDALRQKQPQWIEQWGGEEALLDPKRVAEALRRTRRASLASSAASSTSGADAADAGAHRSADGKTQESGGQATTPRAWARRLRREKDYRGLAAVFRPERTLDPQLPQLMGKRKRAEGILREAGSESVDAILAELTGRPLEDSFDGRHSLVDILLDIGDAKAAPLLKRMLDRGDFEDVGGTTFEAVREFVDQYPGTYGSAETAKCVVCGETRPISRARRTGAGHVCKEGGDEHCERCKAAHQWWGRKRLAEDGLPPTWIVVGAATMSLPAQPGDYAGVCRWNCKIGYCKQHAPRGRCPRCNSELDQ